MNRAFPALAIVFVSLCAAGAGADSGFEAQTSLARQVMLAPVAAADWFSVATVTDGAVAWRDWLPMASSLAGGDLGGAHGLLDLLWIALALAVVGLARSVGMGWPGAAVAGALVAAHPVGVAAHADLAGRGPLLATLGVVAAIAIALSPPRTTLLGRIGIAAAAGAALVVGLVGHPIAVLAPVVAVGGWWSLRREGRRASDVLALAGPVVAVGAWYALRGAIAGDVNVDPAAHGLLGADGEVPVATGAALAGHAIWVGLLGTPLTREPWTIIEGAQSWSQPLAWIGLLFIIGLPVAARWVRVGAPAVALWLLWATLLALSQIADPFASAQAPALLTLVLVGPALAVGHLVRPGPIVGGIVAAACLALVLGPTASAARAYTTERTLLSHERDLFPSSVGLHLKVARHEVRTGQLNAALALLKGVDRDAPGAAALVVEANLGLNRWGTARGALKGVPEPAQTVLACRLGAAADEIGAVRHCERAREIVRGTDGEGEVIAALAKALDRNSRSDTAEQLLKDAIAERPDDGRLYAALVDYYERVGYLGDAITILESWRARAGQSPGVILRLVKAYERKGQGDLQEKRWQEAVEAFDRALELSPAQHQLRYHLAKALSELGQDDRARAEIQQATEAGVEPPPPPGMTAPP